jgi:hypothetical protein
MHCRDAQRVARAITTRRKQRHASVTAILLVVDYICRTSHVSASILLQTLLPVLSPSVEQTRSSVSRNDVVSTRLTFLLQTLRLQAQTSLETNWMKP